MREQDLEFNPEYKYAKGGSIIGIQDPYELENQGNRYLESQGIDTKKFGVVHYDGFGKNSKLLKDVKGKDDEGNLNPLFMYERTPQTKSMTKGFQRGKNIYAKGGKISDETYREVYYAHLYPEYDSMEQVKRDVNRLMKRENISMEELLNEIPDQWAKGGEIELGEISKVDLVSHWSSGKKYNYKGEDYLVSKLGGVRNDFFFQKNGNQYFLILDENNGKYFPSGLYAKGGEVKDYNLMVRKTPNSSWEFVNKRPMTYSDAEKMYEEYNNSGIKHHELDIHIDLPFAKGGKTKKFPVAVQRRVDEINEMLPKVNESGDYASTYAGSTMESYIILDKPIQIKGNFVYISEEDSRWGKYGFEKRYNVNDTRDVYESIKGRKALMSDLGIIKRAFTKLLKSEGKMAKGGIAKKSEYISNRDIVSLTHKKGGTKKTLKGSQLVDGAYAKKKIMRKKPTKSDQLSLLNKGGEIVRAYDVNINSGVGTYARGGKMAKGGQLSWSYKEFKGDDALEKANKFISNNKNKYQTQLIFINDGFGVEYRPLRKMARGGKISKDDAIVKALKMGVDFNKDFHAQSFGGELTELAKETGYRKSKSSSGSTGRAFFEHLERRYDKNPSYYNDMVKSYARGGKMARGGKTYKNLSAKEKAELRKMQEAAIESYRKTQAGGKAKSSGKTYKDLSAKEKAELRKKQLTAIESYRKTQSKKMAVGGKTTMAGDTDFPSELLNYAKGGKTKKFSDYLQSDSGEIYLEWYESSIKDSRGFYDDGTLQFKEFKTIEDAEKFYKNNLDLNYKKSYAKGGKFASGGNVSYNGWTNYATWVTSLEILDGIDWKDYNMGEPISAEMVEDYVQEVMEQSPNLALSFANRFLNDVNYREIAENANDNFDLDDGEKDEYAKGGTINSFTAKGFDDEKFLYNLVEQKNTNDSDYNYVIRVESKDREPSVMAQFNTKEDALEYLEKFKNRFPKDKIVYAKGGQMKKPMIRYSGRR